MTAASEDEEAARHWALVRTPLGLPWSGRARYAAAMYLYVTGALSADVLEVYRTCARLDGEDPLRVVEARGIGAAWVRRVRSQDGE